MRATLPLTLALVGLLGVAVEAAPRSESSSPIEKIRGVLEHRDGDSRTEADVVQQLARIGPDAIPDLFALYNGENMEALLGQEATRAEDWWCGPDEFGNLALAAMAELPAKRVVAHLQERTGSAAPLELRLASVRVLGRLGSAKGLDLLFSTAADIGERDARYRSVHGTLVNGLAGIFAGDPATTTALERKAEELTPAELELCIEAIALADRPEGMAFLIGLLGKRTVELDLAAMDAAAELASRYPWRVSYSPLPAIRALLTAEDSRLRRGAAAACGRLHDVEALPVLIALLKDKDTRVARAAEWSLREMSGQKALDTPKEWRRWRELDDVWWKTEGARLRQELTTGDSGRVLGAAKALALHPFHRDEIAADICAIIADQPPLVIFDLCATLQQVDSAVAVPYLVDLMFDPNKRLRRIVCETLRELTGHDLPPEPWIWEKVANG